jgi:hypothetical protein
MSDWTARIDNHTIWQQMQTLGPAIDQALGREGIEPLSTGGLDRIRTILTFAGRRLAGADRQLISVNSLDVIAGGLQQAISEVEAYIADGDASHIANANLHMDSVLNGVPTINYPFVTDDWTALSDAASAYRRTLDQNMEQVNASGAQIRANFDVSRQNLSVLDRELETERAKLSALVADFQTQFVTGQDIRTKEFTEQVQAAIAQIQSETSALQQRLAELGTEITTERGKLTTVASEFQLQFSTAQESRSREFAETQTSRQEKFGNLIAEYSQRLTDQNAAFTKQSEDAFQRYQFSAANLEKSYAESAQAILDKIEVDRKAVEKLVGVIGNLGVTSGYLTTANHARRLTWFWQGVTVSALVVLSVLAYGTLALLENKEGRILWGIFAARVVLLGSVGVIAAYASSQGDKLFDVEKRNRKLALELEAIGPYSAPLAQEEQDKFRLQIGERSFGRDDDSHQQPHRKSPATLLDLFKSKEAKEVFQWILDIVRKGKVD